MEKLVLNNGVEMPLEGFGVFQIPDAAQCEQVVYDAIKTGYRLLDTAAAYGNEAAVGKGVARAIADGLATRKELFVTTKVWVNDMENEEDAYQAVKTSLGKLEMDYVDLILLHQPMKDYFAAYRGITRAYKEGLTKAIGVANFYPAIRRSDACRQSGGTASILRAGRRVGKYEDIWCCSTGMGTAGGR